MSFVGTAGRRSGEPIGGARGSGGRVHVTIGEVHRPVEGKPRGTGGAQVAGVRDNLISDKPDESVILKRTPPKDESTGVSALVVPSEPGRGIHEPTG